MISKFPWFGHLRALQERVGVRILLALAATALAAVGQSCLDERRPLALAIAFLVVGGLCIALGGSSPARPRQEPGGSLDLHKAYLWWSLVFTALALFSFRDNEFSLQGLIAWGLAVLLAILAFPRGTATSPDKPRQRWSLTSEGWLPWPVLGLLVALAVGMWLRLYRLTEIPADLGWDLPYNYTDAQRILQGEHPIFFPDNYGREGLFFYLIVAVSRIVPLSALTLRVASALVGILTIPAAYALGREVADDETGAWAALALAINKWHVVLSRSGYRVSLMPLWSTLALYLLARALRRGASRDWAWLGVVLGLGLWSYKAFTFAVPTVIAIVVAYGLLARRGKSAEPSAFWATSWKRLGLGLAIALGVTLTTAAPMVRFIIDQPQVYMAREQLGTSLVDESLQDKGMSHVQLYLQNALTSLGTFNYQGDGNPRFGVPFQRQFGFVSGTLLVLGVALALSRLRRGGYLLLLGGLAGLMMPMTVSLLVGETPNCFRSSGTIGPSIVLAAVALTALRRPLASAVQNLGRYRFTLDWREETHTGESVRHWFQLRLLWLPVALVLGALWIETRETSRFYFTDFRRVAPHVENYSMALELAERIIAFDEGPAYIKVWPYWYDGRAVQVHLSAAGRSWGGELFSLSPDEAPLTGYRGKMLVLLHPSDVDGLRALEAAFDRYAVLQDRYPDGEPSLLAFYGER